MPNYFVEECLTFIEQLNTVPVTHEFVTNFCRFLRQFSPELSYLLGFSFAYNCDTIDVIQLIHCIEKFVHCMHEHDVVPDEPEPMINTYNPAKFGRVCYFHRHGCQVRKMRGFTADKTSVNNNFDDIPSSVCKNSFPQVRKKGTLYLFLWFCPIHFHCYWYHIIPGSEGRKDMAASLYTHFEKVPDKMFCTISHSVYQNLRIIVNLDILRIRLSFMMFFTDIHINTQQHSDVIAYLNSMQQTHQNVKASAKLISQIHFCFYFQLFIHEPTKKGVFPKKEQCSLVHSSISVKHV